jgi:7SK snRNA methylphosphate capping enzyme
MPKLAQSWGAYKVVGVDIDDTLIRAAWRRRRTVWSLQEPYNPSPVAAAESEKHTTSNKRKRESSEGASRTIVRPEYFPISCEHIFGPLPIPPSQNRGKCVFPHNLSFRSADWVTTEIPEDKEGYDVVLA